MLLLLNLFGLIGADESGPEVAGIVKGRCSTTIEGSDWRKTTVSTEDGRGIEGADVSSLTSSFAIISNIVAALCSPGPGMGLVAFSRSASSPLTCSFTSSVESIDSDATWRVAASFLRVQSGASLAAMFSRAAETSFVARLMSESSTSALPGASL